MSSPGFLSALENVIIISRRRVTPDFEYPSIVFPRTFVEAFLSKRLTQRFFSFKSDDITHVPIHAVRIFYAGWICKRVVIPATLFRIYV